VGLMAKLVAAQGSKRKRAMNKQCRVEELRMVLRTGDADARQIYQTASSAWDEAGQPDVPLIVEWFANRRLGLTDQDS
jgi:hypothetical protein